MAQPLKWAAELEGVTEVTLNGTADSGYWRDLLQSENLSPALLDGHAQLMIIGADSLFRGFRFREISVSVLVENGAASFLLGAFNSNRFFAFVERTAFSAPYAHAAVALSADPPVALSAMRAGSLQLSAVMAVDGRPPLRIGEEGITAPVYLPGGKVFMADLRGETAVFPFLPGEDNLTIEAAGDAVLQSLVDSGFAPAEWLLRRKARHAKSQTYSREALSSLEIG